MDQEQQTTEIRNTQEQRGDTTVQRQTVQRETTTSPQILLARIIWFIFGAISIIIALRVALLLLAANQGSGFVDFIYGLGAFFAAPFFGIFSYTPVYGSSVFEISSVIAILIYLLLGWGLAKLVTLGSSRRLDV